MVVPWPVAGILITTMMSFNPDQRRQTNERYGKC